MIGIGIITYQRFDRFKECFEHLLKHRRDVNHIVIVDDHSEKDREKYDEYFKSILFPDIQIIINEENKGVGASKNIILKTLYDKGCDFMFTLEDDINIVDDEVFNKYIEASIKSGFQYFNFAHHGPGNHKRFPKVEEFEGIKVAYWFSCIGAFSLHTRLLIDECGYYDENYMNAIEHVDYYYSASLKGLVPPFRKFVDVLDSSKYLREQKNSIKDSSIIKRSDWKENIKKAEIYWLLKHEVSLDDIY